MDIGCSGPQVLDSGILSLPNSRIFASLNEWTLRLDDLTYSSFWGTVVYARSVGCADTTGDVKATYPPIQPADR